MPRPKVSTPHPNNNRYKSLSRDRIRESIDAGKCLARIENVLDLLHGGYLQLGPEETMALRAAMDGSFRLLGKVLPDLKAVEHSGNLQVDTAIKITVSG
jgi:hypothetical protein